MSVWNIMAYLFGYKNTHIKGNIPLVGFSKKAISKIQAKLEQKKLDKIEEIIYEDRKV